MTEEQRRTFIYQLNGPRQLPAFEAAKALWNEPDERVERALILTLRQGRRPFNRAAAAYAMQAVRSPRTIRALEIAVDNKSETPRVRGEAAEALAHYHRKKSHDVLLRGLADRSKDVRFWCAFALGQMLEKQAVGRLKDLAQSDKRRVRGFHSVAKEAADAIKNIEIALPAHSRKKRCVFCVRGGARKSTSRQ